MANTGFQTVCNNIGLETKHTAWSYALVIWNLGNGIWWKETIHVELEQLLHPFASCWFVGVSWAFLLPARRYASAGNSDRNVSVRPFVRLSVTHRYCVKTKKASGMISSPSGSSKTLVFCAKFHHQILRGSPRIPPNGGLKQGWVWKIQRFSSFKRQYLENGSRYSQSYY